MFPCNINLDIDVDACVKTCGQCMCPEKQEEVLQWRIRLLRETKAAVERQVEMDVGKQPLQVCKPAVDTWMGNVDSLGEEVDRLLLSLKSRGNCCWPCSYKSNYKLGESIRQSLLRVQDLMEQRGSLGDNLVTARSDLAANKQTLQEGMLNLTRAMEDLVHKVELQETQQSGMKRTVQVEDWMEKVKSLDQEVVQLIRDVDRQIGTTRDQQNQESSGSHQEQGKSCQQQLNEMMADKLGQVREMIRRKEQLGDTLVYQAHIGRNVRMLRREMAHLKDMKSVVENKVRHEMEADPRVRLTPLVTSWIKDVDSLSIHVGEIPSSEDYEKLPYSEKHQLDVIAASHLDEVQRLMKRKAEAQQDGLVYHEGPSLVEVVEGSSTSVVGGEDVLSDVWKHLTNDDAGIIGLWGMGGVGKTTLLQKINNDFHAIREKGFDMVIWVTVSKDLNISDIRNTIAKRMELAQADASYLRHALCKKRFLLLLDDVWQKMDLASLGVPLPDRKNKCKVILTTRSREVCHDMDAKTAIKVNTLNQNDSWLLFIDKLGTEVDVSNPALQPSIKKVVAMCGGLPLALITVARAMADATTREEWEIAIRSLRDSPSELRGMEDIFNALKFSFDRLKDDSMRECLLFCASFPEDKEIVIRWLVDYWVGEGLLDGQQHVEDIQKARNRGHLIIRSLKHACLLEEGLEGREYVKLHDMTREMGLRLSGRRNKSITDLAEIAREAAVGEVERIVTYTTVHDESMELKFPRCPKLATLIAQCCSFTGNISVSLAEVMPNLRVLDLSSNTFKQDNVPELVSQLLQLRYLSLCNTNIKSLPREFGQLKMLRQLDLALTSQLQKIPAEAVSNLVSLESLNLCYSGFDWKEEENVSLEDLEGMERLVDLGLDIDSTMDFEAFLRSKKLMKCTSWLRLKNDEATETITCDFFHNMILPKHFFLFGFSKLRRIVFNTSHSFSCIEYLELANLSHLASFGFEKVEEGIGALLPSLRILQINDCPSLKDLKWLRNLHSLADLSVGRCDVLVELFGIGGEEDVVDNINNPYFAHLTTMSLVDLTALRSISGGMLFLPSLKRMIVYRCPELKKLPFGAQSAQNLRVIYCNKEWSNMLEWESEDIKSKFEALMDLRD